MALDFGSIQKEDDRRLLIEKLGEGETSGAEAWSGVALAGRAALYQSTLGSHALIEAAF